MKFVTDLLQAVELKTSSTEIWGKLVANTQCSSLLGRLFILHKTIRHRTIRSHMHCTGSYDIQIPTQALDII